MILVAGYCRVSTEREDQANSLEAQRRYFRQYISGHPGWALYDIYADEGITGTSTKRRTQFNRMIGDAHAGKFRLIVTKEVSRFSRNILDTIAFTRQLRALGVGVIFANDRINTLEPESEMLLSLLASLAQEESRRTGSRVVWGQTRQMERGVVFGHGLLGYDVSGGVLSVNAEGAEAVRLIFQKYALEQVGTREIARYLTCKGYRTYSGSTQWNTGSVVRILKNEKYVGDLVQRKTYTPDFLTHEKRANRGEVPLVTIRDHHEPIVSRRIWNMAQERLAQNDRHGAGDGGHSNRYVFSGKIRCGECGRSFVGRLKYLKNGTKIRRWSCATAVSGGTAACGIGKLVRDDDAMQMLKAALAALPVDREAILRSTAELALDALRAGEGRACETPQRLALEMQRIQHKKEAVMDSCFSGEITKDDMQAMYRKYEDRLRALAARQAEALLRRQEARDVESLRAAVRSEAAGILSGEIESEVFYKTVLDSLTVFKDRHMELRLKHLAQVFHFA